MTVDDPIDPIADLIVQRWGRSTLPIQTIGGQAGTAFFYNELVESTPEVDRVREWLVTADELTRVDVAEIRLRPELIEPAGAASDYLAMLEFGQLWSRRSGVAAMRTIGLHEHARSKQWRWNTEQITDGLAARAEHLGAIDARPHKAYALGHTIAEPGQPSERQPLALGTSNIIRDRDRVVHWQGLLPSGFTGAPVFVAEHRVGHQFVLRCIGLIAGHDPNPAVATFDTVRTLISGLIADESPDAAKPRLRDRLTSLLRRNER